MARRRYWFVPREVIRARNEAKDDRIVGLLSPRYLMGFIRHQRPMQGLESNIGDWPNGKKDYADSFASALTLLGESGALVIPEEERNAGEYAPLEQPLPPVYQTVSNYITRGGPIADKLRTRYPVS